MKDIIYIVSGMSCGHCVMAVKKELSKLELAHSEVEIGKVKVVFDEAKVTEKEIVEAIEEAGYKIES